MKNKENTILIIISIIAIVLAIVLAQGKDKKDRCEWENRYSHPNYIEKICGGIENE